MCLAAKYRLDLRWQHPKLVASGMSFRIRTQEAQELADRLHRESVTVLGNRFGVLPLTLPPAGSPASQDKEAPAAFALLSLGDAGADSVFVAELKRLSAVPVDCYYLSRQAPDAERAELMRKLSAYQRVVVSVSGRESDMLAYAEFLLGLELPAPVVYAFFAPYRCAQLLDRALWKAGAIVLGHSGAAVVQKHVAAVLLAKADAHGRLAMSIGRYYPVGAGTDIVAGQAPGRLVPEDYGMRSYELEGIDRLALAGQEGRSLSGLPHPGAEGWHHRLRRRLRHTYIHGYVGGEARRPFRPGCADQHVGHAAGGDEAVRQRTAEAGRQGIEIRVRAA